MDSLAKMHWLEKSVRATTTTQFDNHRRILASFHQQQEAPFQPMGWNTLYEEIYRKKMVKHWEKRDRMGQE
jgi:hypothetical protein